MPRTFVITGAGRGIGKATALALAAPDRHLYLVGRNEEQLIETGSQCLGPTVVHLADVRQEPSVRALFEDVARDFGRLDVLVNCAGFGAFGPTIEEDSETFDACVETNLRGTYLCCKLALKMMLPERRGLIINVLSIAAKVAFPDSAAYCASKWGALGLTYSLAEEVRRQGIKVTAMIPGSVDTPFWNQQSWRPDPKRMIPPADVATAIAAIVDQPPTVVTDEIVLMPPEGIL